MSTYTVQVSNLSPSTTQEHLHEFFSFCGKISSIEHDAGKQAATVHFEKSSAAKTALMLNGGSLDGSTLTVTSENEHTDERPTSAGEGAHIEQSDKPRAAIAAEYLAKGYQLHDHILQRAIELDNKHGISSRFLNYMKSIDGTLGQKVVGQDKTISGHVQEKVAQATQQAKALDEQKGYSKQASDYYTRAISSPWGKTVFQFYTTTSKQVLDIHEEAKRLKETQTAKPADFGTASTGVGTTAPPLDPAVQSTEKPLV
ncbi:uncharacterized protein C8Q71DRAFT_789338 [Rhodofomes roseus]|uniref:RRM domain-containing protein n=1 Tax=Rhodofomes roseus TaxID=34475 RepID=A0A4Y9YHW5_9APHY|nr:uncharacterized protein C8Q71DRAFT_789338 [Rhodofomes roseus]KAH9829648.1 hypothetical protein C8Q71DRAFT_789338 [Rhodofomes roseus]TFY61051.1 hypothetical protein EVJ58_g4754 [Rhodofomes roseus]